MNHTAMRHGRRLMTLLTPALLVISANPAAAKASTFTAPFSGDSAYWGCQPECQRLSFETQQSASKATGAITAAGSLRAPALNTAGANLFAVGLVQQYGSQSKPVSGASATVDYTIESATAALTGTNRGNARVLLIASLWNAGCGCEVTETVIIAGTNATSPPTFSGPRSVTIRLTAPGTSRPIKGIVLIRAQIRVESSLSEESLTGATTERTARAEAQGVVTRIVYSG